MEKIKFGDTYQEAVRFTQEKVQQFADVTGDNNPIHVDAGYASTTPFGKPIVHGFFAGSVFSKVFGTIWPGEGTIYLFQEMSFKAPVFVEQNYTAKFEVVDLIEDKHRATIQCILEDEEGKPAIVGTAKLLHQHKF